MNRERLVLPKNYENKLNYLDTELAIKIVKDSFEKRLAQHLNLVRVSAPLFVRNDSGLNDNLNGVERPVGFDIKDIHSDVEVVHSLAKWKRLALKQYDFETYRGIYTDMNAIRRDEELDNLHSVYVDQWDWEKIIEREERTMDTLKETVRAIVKAIKETEYVLHEHYDELQRIVQGEVFFITSQELEDMYPNKSGKEREYLICKEKRTVFIMQIGDKLKSGMPHDGRAPDYDDWKLNGDLLVYYPILDCALELSSMGIRVDRESLLDQCTKANTLNRLEYPFHKALMNDELPLTMGGGIGQSRLCLMMLNKAHIGEVQVSTWGADMIEECRKHGIRLL